MSDLRFGKLTELLYTSLPLKRDDTILQRLTAPLVHEFRRILEDSSLIVRADADAVDQNDLGVR